MADGFNAPLIIPLGISTTPAGVGFRTPLPFWNAGTTPAIPVVDAPARGGGVGGDDEEEILAVIMAATYH